MMLEVIALTRSELRSNGTSLRTRLADGLPSFQEIGPSFNK